MARYTFLYFVFLTIGWYCTSGHMMCSNSGMAPAFRSPPVKFCTEFAGFGCCSRQTSEEIMKQFDYLKEKIPMLESETECLELLKEQMCQKCSPFSGHMFTFYEKSPIPGLCDGYCQQFYTKCKTVIKYLFLYDFPASFNIQNEMSSFCNYFKAADNSYCFPDLRTNEFVQGSVTKLKTSNEKCLCLEPVHDTLMSPIQVQRPDDGTGRIFVALLSGEIKIYSKDGILISNDFFNISKRIRTRENMGGDLGFLGLSFHPEFKLNGKFYVVYTMNKTNSLNTGIISRFSEFSVNPPSSNKVNLDSERIILDIDVPYHHHIGGQLHFGEDGYFYIFMGDAGQPYDPNNNAQNKSSLLGKVLRVDLDNKENGKPYSIPPDNPFVDDPSFRPEIYAYGLRNPWRCGKDLGDYVTGKGKGRMICGDVGEFTKEEVDIIKKGANYGWNILEGDFCVPGKNCSKAVTKNFEEPIWNYGHELGKSVIGGAFYRGCGIQHLYGAFIVGEWGSGKLFKMVENEDTGEWDHEELYMCNDCPAHLTNTHPTRVYSLDNDPKGEVFMTTSTELYSNDGKVYRLVGGPDSVDGCSAMKLNTDNEETTQHTNTPSSSTETWTTTASEAKTSATAGVTTKPANYFNTTPISEVSQVLTNSTSVKLSNELATKPSSHTTYELVSQTTKVNNINWTKSTHLLKMSSSSTFSPMSTMVGTKSLTDHSVEIPKVYLNNVSVDKAQTESMENTESEMNDSTHHQTGLDKSLSTELLNGENGNDKNSGESRYYMERTYQHVLVALAGIFTFRSII